MESHVQIKLKLDKKLSRDLKKKAKILGTSTDKFIIDAVHSKIQSLDLDEIHPEVSKLIGIIHSNKSYNELIQDVVKEKIRRYESIN